MIKRDEFSVMEFFQPNKKSEEADNTYGDCTIRALCKALNKEWLEVFDMLVPLERKYQCPFPCMPKELYDKSFSELGFSKITLPRVKKGEKRMTPLQWAIEHPKGIYILRMSAHFSCCYEGIVYDTWDCSKHAVYSVYQLKGEC